MTTEANFIEDIIDETLPMQVLFDVMAKLKAGGVDRVMIATSPRDGRRAP